MVATVLAAKNMAAGNDQLSFPPSPPSVENVEFGARDDVFTYQS